METLSINNTIPVSISYGGLNLGILWLVPILILILILKPLLIPRVKKSQNKSQIQRLSLWVMLFYAIKAYFGIAKSNMCEIFMKMGPIVTYLYNSAPSMIVISNDFELIKNIQNSSDEWIGRPKNALLQFRADGCQDRGILTSSGEVWKETRRYTVKTLIQLGLGEKSNLDYTTNEELKGLLDYIEDSIKKTDNKVPIRNLFSLPTINVVWRIIGGSRFSQNDPEFVEIVGASDTLAGISYFDLTFGDFLGFLLNTVPQVFGKEYFAQCTIKKHFKAVLQKHQRALKKVADPEDDENFTDNFLRLINSNNNGGKGGKDMGHIFNLDNLGVTFYDLFEAGVDTTSSALEFALMYLVMNPQVQEKMQNEIKNVIGEKDEPSFYDDRGNMPYTQAVIHELHRMASIVPLNFRCAAKDCHINDIFMRKGSGVVLNLYSVHYDKEFWGDPHSFRPERFLTQEGSLDPSKLRRVINFGGGKRVCIGETVASISVFTFLVGVLQKYKVEKAYPEQVLGIEMKSSFTSRAKSFHARFVPV